MALRLFQDCSVVLLVSDFKIKSLAKELKANFIFFLYTYILPVKHLKPLENERMKFCI